MGVRVRVLGCFAVEVAGAPVPDGAWASRRSRQLVQLLALAPGRRIPVDQAMDALWPDLDPEAARANLHKAASLARRALGSKDAIVIRSGTLQLWPAVPVEVDLAAFEDAGARALADGDVGACARVAATYAGELLPDERYEAWTEQAGERARRLQLDLLRAAGDWTTVVEREPTDERAHRELMRQHMAAGRLHAAIRQFQRARTILRRDVGVPPAAPTLALYREIIGAAAAGWVRPGLVGREVELVRARAALRRAAGGRPAAVLVSGPAGIGKTRLCEELVDQAAAEGWLVLRAAAREPAASVPFAALAEAIAGAIVQRPELADALDDADRRLLARLEGAATPNPDTVHRQSVLHLLMRLAAGSGAGHGLLLVDDLHHADDATLELVQVLSTAPFPRGLLVIASHRDDPPPPLARLREVLARSGTAVEIPLGPLRRAEIEEVVADVLDRRPTPEEIELVWELSGGNAFLVLEMASSGDALADGSGVQAAIAARMQHLPGAAQEVLRRVALVADEFTADELTALADVDADAALAHLEGATEAGVVARLGSRYRFRHDLVRDELRRGAAAHEVAAAHATAAERLAAMGAAPGRVAHHLLLAQRPDEALTWLRRAVADALAVGAHADVVTLTEQALGIAPRDVDLLASRAGALDAIGDPGAPAAYAVAMALATPERRGSLGVRRAKSLITAGDVPGALETLAGIESVELDHEAQLLVARGLASWCIGDLEAAEEAGAAARRLATTSGDLRDFVDATMVLAMVAHQRGGWPQRASLDLLDATLRPDLAAVVMDAHLCIAESYLYGGAPYDEVVAFACDLLARAAAAGAPRAEAFATTLLGEAHLLMGEIEPAVEHLRSAAAQHRRVGVLCGEALSLQRLAQALLARGDENEARAVLDEALVAARGSPVAARHLLDRIYGTVVRAAPDPASAVVAVDEAQQAVRGPLESCPPCSVNLSIPCTIACAAAGRLDQAEGLLARSEAVIGAFYPQGGWQAALDEARSAVARGRGDERAAASLLRHAIEGFDRWGQRLDADRCRASAELLAAGKV
jgi:DNA-binding SARP family transcriptional activator/tetratricopeptide (TPR) repeat protein